MNQVSPHVAFVLLKEARFPAVQDILREFMLFASPGQRLMARPSVDDPSSWSVSGLELRPGGTVFVASIPSVVPNGEADEGAQFSISAIGTNWQLAPHEAHLVVTLSDASGAPAVETVSRFTSLLAAVAKASAAIGIYWGSAGATHDADFFVNTAESPDIFPRIVLWTGVSIASDADGRLSLLSLGMRQLNLPDLWLAAPRSASDALETFFDLLGYVAELGHPLAEGDTVGMSPQQRWPVQYVPSPLDANTKVWRVELE